MVFQAATSTLTRAASSTHPSPLLPSSSSSASRVTRAATSLLFFWWPHLSAACSPRDTVPVAQHSLTVPTISRRAPTAALTHCRNGNIHGHVATTELALNLSQPLATPCEPAIGQSRAEWQSFFSGPTHTCQAGRMTHRVATRVIDEFPMESWPPGLFSARAIARRKHTCSYLAY